jgi:hypothetical protein
MPGFQNTPAPEYRLTATMPSASTTASGVFLGKIGPRGIAVQVPSGWLSGGIGIQVSTDGAAWMNVNDEYNSAVQVSGLSNLATATVVAFPGAAWMVGAYPYARFVSYSAGTQGLSAQPSATPLAMVLLS